MDEQANFTVTLNPPAQAAPIPEAAGMVNEHGQQVIVDSKGRRITLRELTLLQEQDFLAALPAAHVASNLTLGRAMQAVRVNSIGDELMDVPKTQAQYRPMLEKVGKEGLAAVIATLAPPDSGEGDDAADLAKN